MSHLETYNDIVEALILGRLLVAGKKPPARADVRKQVVAVLPESSAAGNRFDEALARLVARGDASQKPLKLTDAGRQRALLAWGIDRLPQRFTWKALKEQFITPRLLGFPTDLIGKAKEGKAKALEVILIQQHYGMPVRSQTVNQFVASMAAQALGQSTRDPFRVAIQRALAEKADGASRPAMGQDGQSANGRPHETGGHSVAGFVDRARGAAAASNTGRFGDNKVFISHAWKQYSADTGVRPLSLDDFKAELLAAHQQHALELARADLVERMDPADVAASEIKYLGSTFHFIRVDS